jgi:hypothetical protein
VVNTPPITFDIAERTDMVSHAEVPVLEKIAKRAMASTETDSFRDLV